MGGGYTITIPQDVPTSSIERDGETLYFQGWMKNGLVSKVYTPNETVEDVNITDVFTPYYAKDSEYPDFVFTVDSVTGEYIIAGANEHITSVTIPALYQGQTVAVIKSNAFDAFYSLQTVEIPQTITKIGNYAFMFCKALTSIEIPNSVTSIGESAFDGCSSLTSVTLGNSVTSIGKYAFYSCKALTSIEIPNSVTSIGESAFDGCSSLTSVTLGNSVTSIGRCAFMDCYNLTSITIPDGVKKIGCYALCYCDNLSTVTFENTSGWYATSSSDYTGGRSITVTNASTNAINLKSNRGSWYDKYLYRQ